MCIKRMIEGIMAVDVLAIHLNKNEDKKILTYNLTPQLGDCFNLFSFTLVRNIQLNPVFSICLVFSSLTNC